MKELQVCRGVLGRWAKTQLELPRVARWAKRQLGFRPQRPSGRSRSAPNRTASRQWALFSVAHLRGQGALGRGAATRESSSQGMLLAQCVRRWAAILLLAAGADGAFAAYLKVAAPAHRVRCLSHRHIYVPRPTGDHTRRYRRNTWLGRRYRCGRKLQWVGGRCYISRRTRSLGNK